MQRPRMNKIKSESVMLEWKEHDHGGVTEIFEKTMTIKGVKSTAIMCYHYGVGVDIGDDTIVHGSTLHSAESHYDDMPEFGLYADPAWQPTWPSEFINWPDFGEPSYLLGAVHKIIHALFLAQKGSRVEIGCIGGHGRTGTILAVMTVMMGRDPKQAIYHIRKHYCEFAIETPIQAWFITAVYEMIRGNKIPDRPKSK